MDAPSNISSSVAKGGGWLGAAGLAVNLLGFVSTLILARLLTPDDFGLVALASTFVALAETFTAVPVSSALIKFKRVENDHLHTAWTLGSLRGVLLAVIIAGLAFPLSTMYDDDRLQPIMFALAGLTLFRCLQNPRYVFFEKGISYSREFVIIVATKVISVIAAAIVAYLYQSYWALIIATAFSGVVRVFLSYWFAPFLPKPSLAKLKEIWAFTGWLTLGSAVDAINSNIDTLIIGATLSASQLGSYRVGSELAAKPTQEIVKPLQRPLFPAFAMVSDDKRKLAQSYVRSQCLLFALVLPFGVGFGLIAEPFVNLVLGEKWTDAIYIIQTLAVAFSLQSFNGPSVSLAYATGNTKAVFTRQLIFFVVRVPTVVTALIIYGLPGLVLARLGTGLFAVLLNLYMVNSIIAISPFKQLQNCWRSLLSAISMSAAVFLVQQVFVFPDFTTGQIAALSLYCLTGAISYPLVHILLWFISGKADGAEPEIIDIGRRVLGWVKRERSIHGSS